MSVQVGRISALGAFIAATIALKLISGGNIFNPKDDAIVAVVAQHLKGQNYNVQFPIYYADYPALMAQKGSCLMYIVPSHPFGWDYTRLSMTLPTGASLAFAYGGSLHPQLASSRLIIDYYARKIRRFFDRAETYASPLAVVSDNATCAAADLPGWTGFPGTPYDDMYTPSAQK